jgi:hypothetical protein
VWRKKHVISVQFTFGKPLVNKGYFGNLIQYGRWINTFFTVFSLFPPFSAEFLAPVTSAVYRLVSFYLLNRLFGPTFCPESQSTKGNTKKTPINTKNPSGIKRNDQRMQEALYWPKNFQVITN